MDELVARGDGQAIDHRPAIPAGRGRLGAFAICAVAVWVDLALHLMFVAPFWSAFWSVGMLPATIVGLFGGVVALLLPLAFFLRSPDAWRVRRVLFLGLLLAAAAEISHSAGRALTALPVWDLGSSPTSVWLQLTSLGRDLGLVASFAGLLGTVLVVVGLARVRERSISPASGRLLALALLGVGILGLTGMRPYLSPPAGVVMDRPALHAALLAAGILAVLVQGWVILAGRIAGEAPRRPWTLAAAATGIGLATMALGGLANLGVPTLDGRFYLLIAGLGLGAGLLLVAAVADGLGASPARD